MGPCSVLIASSGHVRSRWSLACWGLKTEGPNRLTLMRKMGATAAALVTAQAFVPVCTRANSRQTLASRLMTMLAAMPWPRCCLSAIIMLVGVHCRSALNSARTRDNARIASLEGELNEAEAVINSEPSLLFIWRSDAAHPDSIAGDLRGTVRLGVSRDEAGNFSAWLDEESLTALGRSADGSAGQRHRVQYRAQDHFRGVDRGRWPSCRRRGDHAHQAACRRAPRHQGTDV
jgi:hypothetical protein